MTQKMIIFDFDGVLVDTLLVCYGIHRGVNPKTTLPEYKKLFEGNIFNAILPDGTPSRKNPDSREIYVRDTADLHVAPVLAEAVRELSQEHVLVIISSTISDAIQLILKREKLEECFQDIFGRDAGENKTEKIQALLEKYAVRSEDSVFVTDTLGDVLEGEKCGVRSVAVTWGFHDAETLKKGSPVAIVSEPNELLPAILKVLQ